MSFIKDASKQPRTKIGEINTFAQKLESAIGYDLDRYAHFVLTLYSLSKTKLTLGFIDIQESMDLWLLYEDNLK